MKPLAGPLERTLCQLPATGSLLGKQRLSAQHDLGQAKQGWTYPRQILEALEAMDAVPLPARCGFWAAPGGVDVEAVVHAITPAVRRAVEDSLHDQCVPLQALHLTTDPASLRRPLPWRGDLQPLMVVQYVVWRRWRGVERTLFQYRGQEPRRRG